MPSTWGLATTSLVALAMWSACSRKQEPPGDCEVIKTHWMKLVVAESGDPANAQRMYDVCQREKFGAPYIECLRRATDVEQGIACGPKLSGAHRGALRMAHEQAAKAPPPPVQQQPPPPLVWPTPQPAGPAYALYDGKLWMIDVDGKVAKIGAMSSARDLMVASGGDVLAFGSFPVSVARIRAATVSRLPAPKLRGTQVAVDARADRVLVAASDGSSEKGYKTQLAIYDGTAWTAPETVADVGAVTAVMLAADDETWVIGFNGVSRRRGGTWKSWKCPGQSCIYSALARRGETPVILIDDNGRWRTFIVDDKDELVVDMPKGVDWASNGAGRNGVLVETGGGTIRARVGPEITSATTDWDVAWRGVVDGANRFWYRANGGLAVTDIQHETSTYYPSGAPLLAGAAEPSSIAVIGGGPTLPAPQTPKLASKVTGKLKVNGGIQANTPFKVCPAMRDAGNADPCAKSKPVLSGKTNASGAFELADVPAGDYDLAMYLTTSDGKSTWAVVRPAFTVRAGGVARVGTLQLNVSEYWRY
jgi:hypothetical protein